MSGSHLPPQLESGESDNARVLLHNKMAPFDNVAPRCISHFAALLLFYCYFIYQGVGVEVNTLLFVKFGPFTTQWQTTCADFVIEISWLFSASRFF